MKTVSSKKRVARCITMSIENGLQTGGKSDFIKKRMKKKEKLPKPRRYFVFFALF
jgi:hypothetical protein